MEGDSNCCREIISGVTRSRKNLFVVHSDSSVHDVVIFVLANKWVHTLRANTTNPDRDVRGSCQKHFEGSSSDRDLEIFLLRTLNVWQLLFFKRSLFHQPFKETYSTSVVGLFALFEGGNHEFVNRGGKQGGWSNSY